MPMDLLAHRTNDLSGVGMTLHSLLGDHPGTEALKAGRISSPLVAFDFADVKQVFTQFKAMMRDLNGKRVGVRAYTQTTGVWVRGFLAEDYGVDLKSVTWVTFEDPHLAEYREPPNVTRAQGGKPLNQMLLDGEIDAAILGDVA